MRADEVRGVSQLVLIAVAVSMCVLVSFAMSYARTAFAATTSSSSTASAATSASSAASAATSTSTAASAAPSTAATASPSSAALTSTSSAADDDSKLVLFINSYDPGFDTVPVVTEQVAAALKGHATVHYLYMDEKYETDEFATQQLKSQLDYLTSQYHYDAVILGDDAAFDFAIENRDTYFSGTPLVYEDINSIDKAKLYENDPLIIGVVEAFPMKETIVLARQILPNAKRVVVISDGSVSAAGSVEQALAEKVDFPDLSFETFDCSTRTPERIAEDIAAYGDDTILLYTVFNVDGNGNRYSVSQGVKLVTDAAQVPVFKADGVGVGDGLLGGYVLSYKSIGEQTAQIVLDVLAGDSTPAVKGYTVGTCEYLFDVNVMKRFGLSKSGLPGNAVYLNDTHGFFETYGQVLLWWCVVVAIIVAAIVWYARRQHKKLSRELAERNVELKSEEAANRAKTEFISRMSHDIRTPLNAILGMNELAIEDAEDPAAVRNYLGKSHASAELLLSLVNNILDVSKIESGKMQLEPMPCDLSSFFDDLRGIFEPLCARKGVTLRIEEDADGIVVMADRVRLNQVFCNLLSNAVKFTPEGGNVILRFSSRELASGDAAAGAQERDAGADGRERDATADARRQEVAAGAQERDVAGRNAREQDAEKVLSCDFTVADTGRGIAEDFQKKMFQAFTQDLRVAKPNEQGSGLGLMIVKSIVELMGGSISVQSKVDEGTSFLVHLDLPISDADDAADEMAGAAAADGAASASAAADSAASAGDAGAAASTATSAGDAAVSTATADGAKDAIRRKIAGRQVLLVEDNDINAEIVLAILERNGMKVVRAENGKIAVDMVAAATDGAFDVILMDNRMPVMSGLEATRAIRALHRTWAKTVPIIALTADAFDDDIRSFMDSGMDAYLTKPIDVGKLCKKIAEFV